MDIPKEKKIKLDALFDAFSIVAEGTYVYVCDMSLDISRWSKNAVDYFGLPGEYMEAAGDIWEEHIHPEDRDTYRDSIMAIFTGEDNGHDMQYRAIDLQGNYVMCTCRGAVLSTGGGVQDYFVGVIRNHGISSHINVLTGLRNQYGFFEDLKLNVMKEKPFTVVFFGISHFSEINSVYGYAFGDFVIQRIARMVLTKLGNRGALYRLDGLKFAVISYSLSMEELGAYYQEMKTKMSEGVEFDGRRVRVESVAGMMSVDTFPISDQVVYSCLSYAYDTSKYEREGELCIFNNSLSEENDVKIELLNTIRNSLVEGCKNFCLYYQPTVDADTEKLHGAEALIRWRNDEYGLVYPNSFINVLENDTLFPVLGEWILRRAMNDGNEILAQRPNFIMNVNLSYSQIKKGDFVEVVKRLLEETGYPPRNLCLEVTERCRFIDKSRLLFVVNELRELGIRIALDDFGTGFSSVLVLKELPCDTIKIDRAFVKDIEKDEKEEKLLEYFTGMASLYGSDVCVEGVETEVMRDKIRKSSANTLQGYLYSKPISYEEFSERYLAV